jgi:DNA-3-methyladenine glycosylase II
MSQAVAATSRITELLGARVTVGGATLPVFPGPDRLEGLPPVRGVAAVKAEWLRALAGAALDGRLEAARLRALPAEEALAELSELPGVGPFSAELILVRGAGHPDLMPEHERRVRAAMADAYDLGADPTPAALARIAEAWRPYRSWVCVLLRAAAATG